MRELHRCIGHAVKVRYELRLAGMLSFHPFEGHRLSATTATPFLRRLSGDFKVTGGSVLSICVRPC